MKWIGQHIWDFISRFRNDVYIESLAEVENEFSVMVDTDGKLTKSTHPGERSRIQVRNDEGATIPAGAPLYSKGEIGGSERILVGICDSSDAAKMPCIGVAEFEMNTTSTKDSFAVTQGVYNTNISGFTGLSVGDVLYISSGSAPHLTQAKPTASNLIQNVGIVLKTNSTICQGLLVSAIGRTNDVPTPIYVDHANQRVGVGDSSPDTTLDVAGDLSINGYVIHNEDDNTKVGFPSNDTFTITTNNVVRFTQTTTRSTFASTEVIIPLRKLSITGTTAGNHDGDVVKFGGTESLAAGRVYFYDGSGWALADADAESTTKGLLAVALGEESDEAGMLIRGMVTLSIDPGNAGDQLFVSETGGQATTTPPTGTGKVVRHVGYCLDSTNGQIYFNPDNHYTVL